MAATREGGLKAAATNRARHGEDFYKRIGAIGGQHPGSGGFGSDRELASRAGRIGGLKSRRRKIMEAAELEQRGGRTR